MHKNKNKQCTHSTPLKGVLFNILIMTKTLKTSFYLFTQFYFALFFASQMGHNAPLSFAPTWTGPKKYYSWPWSRTARLYSSQSGPYTEKIYHKPEIKILSDYNKHVNTPCNEYHTPCLSLSGIIHILLVQFGNERHIFHQGVNLGIPKILGKKYLIPR